MDIIEIIKKFLHENSIIYLGGIVEEPELFFHNPIYANEGLNKMHVTLAFGKEEMIKLLTSPKYNIRENGNFVVSGYGANMFNEAISVDSIFATNPINFIRDCGKVPHITLGCDLGGKPVLSGQLDFKPVEFRDGWMIQYFSEGVEIRIKMPQVGKFHVSGMTPRGEEILLTPLFKEIDKINK